MKQDRANAASFIGIGGLASTAFLYGYSAIALPSWLHTAVMPLVWLALFVLGCRWFLPRPRWVVGAAVVSAVAWFAFMLGFGANG